MIRFLVDESVSGDVVAYLRSAGHDVVYIAEVAPSTQDQDILERAVEEDRLLVTNDKDFGELVFRRGQHHQGVLLFRLKKQHSTKQVAVLSAILNQHLEHIIGQFVIVREDRIRIHGGMIFLTKSEGEE